MNILLSTGCLYKYPLDEIFQIAELTGFDGIELLIERNNCHFGPHHIRELSDKYDIPVLSLHSPFMSCDGWGDFWDSIWRSLVMATELSIPLLNFHPPTGIFPRHRLNYELSEHILTYKKTFGDSSIILTIENLPTIGIFRKLFINRLFPHVVNNIYKIPEFTVSSDIYITLDTTHTGTAGINLLEVYAVFKARIANIHLSDYDGRSQHLVPGTGYLPLKELLTQIKLDGYHGLITLETCPAAMECDDKRKAVQNAEKSLRYIKDTLHSSILTT